MFSSSKFPALILVTALLLGAAFCGLAASGHFPREQGSVEFQSGIGEFILFGTLASSILSLAVGIGMALRLVPWYAAVLGGGAVLLAAPLLLRLFPDSFVDSRAALLTFASACTLLLVILFRLVGGSEAEP